MPINYGTNDVSTSGTITSSSGVFTNLTIGSSLAVSGVISVDNLKLDGNTLSATNTDGNVIVQTSGTGALQRDGGGNARGSYAVDWQNVRSTDTMVAGGNYSVIGGGLNNIASGNESTVGGGRYNTASGYRSTVGGGSFNIASGTRSTVGGGGVFIGTTGNTASGNYSTVGGGGGFFSGTNTASGTGSTVSGGGGNTASGNRSTVGGGFYNTASANYSTVGGGRNNTASANYSTVSGGHNNLAKSARSFVTGTNNVAAQKVRRANNITSSTNTITVLNATAADFNDTTTNAVEIRYFYNNNWNRITRTASSATQSGSDVTLVLTANVGVTSQTWSEVSVVNVAETDTALGQVVNGTSNIASGSQSTVGGGRSNTASGSQSTVSGGTSNNASGTNSTVGGGYGNTASGNESTVGGGRYNTASGYRSTVGGGSFNIASATWSTVGGGRSNTASGSQSTVSGGFRAAATRYGEMSHAAGRFANDGDAQHSIFTLRNKTSGATAGPTELKLNGSSTNLTVPSGSLLSGTINVLGSKSDGSVVARYLRQFSVKNVGGTTSLIGSVITLGTDETNGTSLNVTANDASDFLSIAVSGVNNETWRWVGIVDAIHMEYGT